MQTHTHTHTHTHLEQPIELRQLLQRTQRCNGLCQGGAAPGAVGILCHGYELFTSWGGPVGDAGQLLGSCRAGLQGIKVRRPQDAPFHNVSSYSISSIIAAAAQALPSCLCWCWWLLSRSLIKMDKARQSVQQRQRHEGSTCMAAAAMAMRSERGGSAIVSPCWRSLPWPSQTGCAQLPPPASAVPAPPPHWQLAPGTATAGAGWLELVCMLCFGCICVCLCTSAHAWAGGKTGHPASAAPAQLLTVC